MPEVARSALVARLRSTLLTQARPTGGWGYLAGGSPRIESTAWAILALIESQDESGTTPITPHLNVLLAAQRADGLLVEAPTGIPNFTANGTAAVTLQQILGSTHETVARLLEALVKTKGIAAASDGRQHNELQAWPSIPGTFSWVEPTAWCLLALKRSPVRTAAVAARIDEAERLLIDRSCDGGGWNFGNANVLGQDLRPYLPTTALALMAMQDRRSNPAVERGIEHLWTTRTSEPTAMALALAAIVLRLYGRPVVDVEDALAADLERADRLGNLQCLAMMLYGLTAGRHQVRALRV